MAEWPEIHKLQTQMDETLRGKRIAGVELLQPKCCNVSPEELTDRLVGASVEQVRHKGKWILTHLSNGQVQLLSLGMGADVLYSQSAEKPPKYQAAVDFEDGSGYTAKFWWFGHFRIAREEELDTEPNTGEIGIDPFDPAFTEAWLIDALHGRRGQIKTYLLNQKNIGGIGNMYAHDILFKSGLHPQMPIQRMDEQAIRRLHGSIQSVLGHSLDIGGFGYEKDFFGEKGGFTEADFLVSYREGQPCPICGEAVQQIKTGSTSSYICPNCQPL